MIRTRDDDFLKNHSINGVWGKSVNEFKDALDRSQTFNNLTSPVDEIKPYLSSCNSNSNATTIATTIKKLLSSIINQQQFQSKGALCHPRSDYIQ
jgi:uncharacterized protein YpuA (DUF1002 family)